MKYLMAMALLIASTNAFALSFTELAGTYNVTSELVPILNVITINQDGSVKLVEVDDESEEGFVCKGQSTIDGDMVTSEMTCEDGGKFSQRVNFTGITSFDEFTAPVYSSLFGAELPMNFKKVAATKTATIDIEDLVGTYDVADATGEVPVTNVITIDKDLNVTLIEKSPYGEFNCAGKATITGTKLESVVTCENGAEFTQRVNLEGVQDYSKFTVPVYSSLFTMEFPMTFTKR